MIAGQHKAVTGHSNAAQQNLPMGRAGDHAEAGRMTDNLRSLFAHDPELFRKTHIVANAHADLAITNVGNDDFFAFAHIVRFSGRVGAGVTLHIAKVQLAVNGLHFAFGGEQHRGVVGLGVRMLFDGAQIDPHAVLFGGSCHTAAALAVGDGLLLGGVGNANIVHIFGKNDQLRTFLRRFRDHSLGFFVVCLHIVTAQRLGNGNGHLTHSVPPYSKALSGERAFVAYFRPISSRTSMKHFRAKSRSSRLWAAETWVRMRALPWGTTG